MGNYNVGQILKVKTSDGIFHFEKVISTEKEVLTETMQEKENEDVCVQGLTPNWEYSVVPDYLIVAFLRSKSTLRQRVIGQSGYGMDGCTLCGSRWLRRPNCEKDEHDKYCPAAP